MVNNIEVLTGTVGAEPVAGTIAKATIVSITEGAANDFMTDDQCVNRKTALTTPYINIEMAIPEVGIQNKNFRDYRVVGDPGAAISPNTIHGRILKTYPNLAVDGTINMIASEKKTPNGTIVVWNMVLS